MNKTSRILILAGIALSTTGCALIKSRNATTVDSGDARPLFPVTVVNTTSGHAIGLEGRWYVKTVGRMTLNDIEDADWPFIEFVAPEARFYGNDGCNIINGSYRLGQAQTLTLSDIATTMRFCPDDTLSYHIVAALNSTRNFATSLAPDGSSILSLNNDKNIPVMTLRKSTIDFLAGPWQVVEINGTPCSAADARLIFDVNTNRITGNAGCNRLNGEITRDPKHSSSVQFSNLATTRMTCPDIQTESALLIALEEVASARKHGNYAELQSASGTVVIKLKKLTKEDLQPSEQEE